MWMQLAKSRQWETMELSVPVSSTVNFKENKGLREMESKPIN